ncbi:uncharacterized protein LOC120348269 [Styela clava]
MNLHIIISGIFVLSFFLETGSLRCFNCLSYTYDPTDGCHGDDFSDDYLIDCAAEDQYCLVTKIGKAHGFEYNRTCSPVAVDIGCEEDDRNDNEYIDFITFLLESLSATKCVYTCDTDGCNTLSIFPGEDGYTPPATTPLETTAKPSGATQTLPATTPLESTVKPSGATQTLPATTPLEATAKPSGATQTLPATTPLEATAKPSGATQTLPATTPLEATAKPSGATQTLPATTPLETTAKPSGATQTLPATTPLESTAKPSGATQTLPATTPLEATTTASDATQTQFNTYVILDLLFFTLIVLF